jgi:hypothetical protein
MNECLLRDDADNKKNLIKQQLKTFFWFIETTWYLLTLKRYHKETEECVSMNECLLRDDADHKKNLIKSLKNRIKQQGRFDSVKGIKRFLNFFIFIQIFPRNFCVLNLQSGKFFMHFSFIDAFHLN